MNGNKIQKLKELNGILIRQKIVQFLSVSPIKREHRNSLLFQCLEKLLQWCNKGEIVKFTSDATDICLHITNLL